MASARVVGVVDDDDDDDEAEIGVLVVVGCFAGGVAVVAVVVVDFEVDCARRGPVAYNSETRTVGDGRMPCEFSDSRAARERRRASEDMVVVFGYE